MNSLIVQDIHIHYGAVGAIQGVSLQIEKNEIVTVLGANGAGKSTLLGGISGIVPIRSGLIIWNGCEINSIPAEGRVRLGIAHVPEGRKVFARLTVSENLDLGAFLRTDTHQVAADKCRMLDLFPPLKARFHQAAGTLSGGEQQMLALSRALMSRPKLLLLDEPSMGIAPKVTRRIFEVILELHKLEGLTILLIEQNAHLALKIASRAYVLESGKIVAHGDSASIMSDPRTREAYLGRGP